METMNSLAAKESHSPSTPHSADIARAAGIITAKPLRMEIRFAGADIPTAEIRCLYNVEACKKAADKIKSKTLYCNFLQCGVFFAVENACNGVSKKENADIYYNRHHSARDKRQPEIAV